MKKVYVNPKQRVSITCDHCGSTYTDKVPMHIRGNTLVKARCRCGHDMDVVFEFRQAYRKPTSLYGQLQKPAIKTGRQAAQVQDLSRGGLRFSTREWHSIHHGDVFMLAFTLDDPKRSQIDKQIIVKYVQQQTIGAQFAP